ncbi:MAG: tripartite tricarboxylate transporter TctB family protein [Pseudomonadota bacterium]
MKRPERNRQEIAAGLAWTAIGLGAIAIAANYAFGTIIRMGPGFVPILLGALLAFFGVIAAWQGRREPEVPLDLRWRPFAFIIGGIVIWVLLIDHVGFVPSTVALVAISAQAERDVTWLETLLLAAGMTLVGYLIFIRGIGIPIAAFGS